MVLEDEVSASVSEFEVLISEDKLSLSVKVIVSENEVSVSVLDFEFLVSKDEV